jgi:hypothetical protein
MIAIERKQERAEGVSAHHHKFTSNIKLLSLDIFLYPQNLPREFAPWRCPGNSNFERCAGAAAITLTTDTKADGSRVRYGP